MEQDRELKDVMLRFYEAWNAGDTSSVSGMASDLVFIGIGTEPSDWWDAARLARIADHRDDPYQVSPGDIRAFRLGDVGIVGDTPTFVDPDGSETPFRQTAVFHREGDDWKLVQTHISLGVRSGDVFREGDDS